MKIIIVSSYSSKDTKEHSINAMATKNSRGSINTSSAVDNCKMNRNQEKVRAQSISSTPIVRIKGVRESLGRIKQNTVSGMVKLFSKQKKVIEIDSPTEVDHKSSQDDKLIVRQISFFNDLSSINQASEYDLKLQSPDSGYDSFAFRARSSSVNASSINNQSRAFLAHYAKYPNFKWDYLKYFGEDPKEYLSRHNIDLDTICEDDSRYRHTIGRNNERSVANNNSFDGMRKRSQSFNSKSVCKQATPSVKYPNNTNFKVSNVKYFGVDSSQRYNSVYMGNEQKKIVSPKETYSADCRKNISNNAIGNLQQKPLNGGSVAQIQELNEEVVDSDIESLDGQVSAKRKPKYLSKSLPKRVKSDLRSRIQQSIDSYNNIVNSVSIKSSVRRENRNNA